MKIKFEGVRLWVALPFFTLNCEFCRLLSRGVDGDRSKFKIGKFYHFRDKKIGNFFAFLPLDFTR